MTTRKEMSQFNFIRFFATNVGLTENFAAGPIPRAPAEKPDLRPKLRDQVEVQNHYRTMGVGWDASPETIRKAYKQLALFYHPDKRAQHSSEASAQFSKISAAYAVLSDPLRRLVYDLVLGIRDKTDSEVRSFASHIETNEFRQCIFAYVCPRLYWVDYPHVQNENGTSPRGRGQYGLHGAAEARS